MQGRVAFSSARPLQKSELGSAIFAIVKSHQVRHYLCTPLLKCTECLL